MTLAYDMARCGNYQCDFRSVCRRTEPGRVGYQLFTMFDGVRDCEGLIPNENYEPSEADQGLIPIPAGYAEQ